MTPQTFNIVIVGGGIAGLTAAIALRGPNRSITILEQSSQHRELGAAISLQPNASKILTSCWDLGAILAKTGRGIRDNGMRIYNAQGTLINTLPFQTDTYDADRVVYHRVDLLEALKEAVFAPEEAESSVGGDDKECFSPKGPPAQLRLGVRVVSCDCDTGTVTLADGTTLAGDLVVAADGIHSQLRKHVLGKEVDAIPTGVAAYRIITPTDSLILNNSQNDPGSDLANVDFKPQDEWTSMVVGYDRRIIMGPCRNGTMFSIVALVPDQHMHEKVADTRSWTSSGSLEHLLESFEVFPEWVKRIFRAAPSLGLWQLRDLDPLPTWTRGRVLLIGDAAHAMLPTMGQGASQSVEDAEALQSFFADVKGKPDGEEVARRLEGVFRCRYERTSLIQAYSRQQAGAGASKDGATVTLNPLQFQDYTCRYEGAKEWEQKAAAQRSSVISA